VRLSGDRPFEMWATDVRRLFFRLVDTHHVLKPTCGPKADGWREWLWFLVGLIHGSSTWAGGL
jgi:hypothetical protein